MTYSVGFKAQPMSPGDRRNIPEDTELQSGKVYEAYFVTQRLLTPGEEKMVINEVVARARFEDPRMRVIYGETDGSGVMYQYAYDAPRVVTAADPVVTPIILWATVAKIVAIILAITVAIVVGGMFIVIPLTNTQNTILEKANPLTIDILSIATAVVLVAAAVWLVKGAAPDWLSRGASKVGRGISRGADWAWREATGKRKLKPPAEIYRGREEKEEH